MAHARSPGRSQAWPSPQPSGRGAISCVKRSPHSGWSALGSQHRALGPQSHSQTLQHLPQVPAGGIRWRTIVNLESVTCCYLHPALQPPLLGPQLGNLIPPVTRMWAGFIYLVYICILI